MLRGGLGQCSFRCGRAREEERRARSLVSERNWEEAGRAERGAPEELGVVGHSLSDYSEIGRTRNSLNVKEFLRRS